MNDLTDVVNDIDIVKCEILRVVWVFFCSLTFSDFLLIDFCFKIFFSKCFDMNFEFFRFLSENEIRNIVMTKNLIDRIENKINFLMIYAKQKQILIHETKIRMHKTK